MLRGKSSLSSLSPPHYGDIVALLYKKLDISSQLSFSEDSVENLTYVLRRCISPLSILDIGL
jgi:hypothetical protein